MQVSIIIPAYNAAGTIAETLASVRAQTFPDWEAIVVDDGSSDGTADITASFMAQDVRIRLASQPPLGVSAARNTGISLARFPWVLFLDADDWLLPLHLERLTNAFASDPGLDAVHCGWARVTPDGTRIGEQYSPQSSDLFAALTRYCALAVHTCVVRRALVEAVGGFDTSFRTCEEWDLWQRLARTGTHFGAVREVLALYRMRPDTASVDGFQVLTDGLRVLTQGHTRDPRVLNPAPAYAHGLPAEQLPRATLLFACWCAGLVLGRGQDARPLLSALQEERDPQLYPDSVAGNIFQAVPLPTCQPPMAWIALWPGVEQRLNEFLLALEGQAQALGLARCARLALERRILEHSTALWPLTIGATHAVQVEVTGPISDILLPGPVERLQCVVELEGERLGTLELPVCQGSVPRYVLTDAIAAEFAWPIIGRFFEHTVYRDLRFDRGPAGLSLWREALCLAEGLPEDEQAYLPQIHDRVGWTVFLQEIWGRPDWPQTRFYDAQAGERAATRLRIDDGWLTVEISEELPEVEVACRELDVMLTVGGVALGVVTIRAKHHILRPQELRAALTGASGFELCRTAVREALLGTTLEGLAGLQARLAATAATTPRHGHDMATVEPANVIFAPDWRCAVGRALPVGETAVLLARRTHGAIGTSISRRAALPVAAVSELVEGAAVAAEPVLHVPRLSEQPERVLYMPDLLWRPGRRSPPSVSGKGDKTVRPVETAVYGRSHFETLFATQSDPWEYTSPYEQTKYEQTLALLPPARIGSALELACAEGHFTIQLAPRVGTLIAADISQVALERAAKRCAHLENTRFVRLDLIKDPLPSRFELIVCSEVLYFTDTRETLRVVARKLASALVPGGYLLTAHANLVVDEPKRTGFDWAFPFGAKVIGGVLARTRPLRLVKELCTPLYRIQLFRREARVRLPFRRSPAEVINLAQPTPLLPKVAAHVLWHGGRPQSSGATQAVVTDRLPILMYHRVAPTGSLTMARYRVQPEAFAEQLRYLHNAGYYSVNLEHWRAAVEAKRPLPGRAVLITFDDGYLDFLTQAWPLLKQYGFSATVFLITDKIGRSNSWDHVYGEEVPLLRWEDIRQLQDEGVEFGSYSSSHCPLTALSPAAVVHEGAHSRALLERELRVPVQAFAYPYGDMDQVVQHLIGACGYVFGLSCRPALSGFQDPLLALPRIEVTGSDSLQEFVAKLDR
jgi:peptidoglycan/xylan/chitin deacetylase (PgdA/CDA1 family)/SAM-dependent methyltransferase